jgi:hypothetical protein
MQLLALLLHYDVGARFLAVAYFTLAHDVKVFWSWGEVKVSLQEPEDFPSI